MSESMSDGECAMPTVEQLLGPVVRTEEEMITAEGLGNALRSLAGTPKEVGELLAHAVATCFPDRGERARCITALGKLEVRRAGGR